MNTLINLPTEKDVENAVLVGRQLAEKFGSVSLAVKAFGEAIAEGFAKGIQNARIAFEEIDWERIAKKARRRARYQRRYRRIGERMRRQ